MSNLKRMLAVLDQDESGQDLIEYALIAALIALGSITTMNALAGNLTAAFTAIGAQLTANVPAA